MNQRINILTQILTENGECVFPHNTYAVKIEEGCAADYIYNLYESNGSCFDGGEYDGKAKDVISWIISNC